MSPSSFPSMVPRPGAPFPPRDTLGGGSPASAVLRGAPTPGRPSRRASFPSLGGTTFPAPLFAPTHAGAAHVGLGLLSAGSPPALWGGDDRVSQVPGESPRVRALLYDPGGTGYTRPVQCADAAFRLTQGVGSRHHIDCGAQSHGPHTRCLRFAGRVSPPPRKTRFRLWVALCRTGLATRWTPTQKVSAPCRHNMASPFPRLLLAHGPSNINQLLPYVHEVRYLSVPF